MVSESEEWEKALIKLGLILADYNDRIKALEGKVTSLVEVASRLTNLGEQNRDA